MAALSDTCPVCEGKRISAAGKILWRCGTCGHAFLNPCEITKSYDFDYVDKHYSRLPTGNAMSWLRLGVVRSFVCGGRLLDVGYGDGSFLKVAAKAGFDCWGSDVHGQGERYGVRDIPLEEAVGRDWNVVTMYDSVEHFPNFHMLRRLFAAARVVVISTPWRPDGLTEESGWRHWKEGEHVQMFSPASLERLLRGKKVLLSTNLEDAIRKSDDGSKNILTQVYGGLAE